MGVDEKSSLCAAKRPVSTQIEPWYVMLGKQFVGMMPFMLIIAAVLSGVTAPCRP